MDEKQSIPESAKLKTLFLKWLDNFWYHYKWHTIAVAFVVCILIICISQTASRPTYDAHVIYAGGTDVSKIEGDEDSEFKTLMKAYQRFVPDFDGDGERRINLATLFLPSAEDIKEVESKNDGTEINYTLIADNDEMFRQCMTFGDYYIIILSESLYTEWTKNAENNPFAEIRAYLPEDAEIAENEGENGYRLAGEHGVYLSSTPLADNPGFKDLGEDSIIVMRRFTTFGTQMKGSKATEFYKHNENILRLMLKDQAYS